MIFLTVGTQLPFERLVEAADRWAGDNPKVRVFGQIGKTCYKPRHFDFTSQLRPEEYAEKIEQASIIIGHVGMGTIITGLVNNKRLILMPRHADKGEHRNDHQLSTAKHFGTISLIDIVDSYKELSTALSSRVSSNNQGETKGNKLRVSAKLISTIEEFVDKS